MIKISPRFTEWRSPRFIFLFLDTELSSTDQEDVGVRGPTARKKAQLMDKFVNDLDNARKMKQNVGS